MQPSAGGASRGWAVWAAPLNDPAVWFAFAIGAALFLAGGALIVTGAAFPTAVDELQHLSFIRSMGAAPALFPDYGHYPTLRPDLSGWGADINYIAHPPLYYVLMSPLPFGVAGLRWVNLALAFAGCALAAMGGARMLDTRMRRVLFVALVFLFPRSIATAGMINNDNLVMLETGALLLALAADRPRPALVALILALLGWTKLNAFVGLAAVVGLLHARAVFAGEARLYGRATGALVAGALAGLAPVIANFVTLGAPVYPAVDFLYVPPDRRLSLDFLGFVSFFAHRLGLKFPPVEGTADFLWPVVIAFLFAAVGCALARTRPRERAFALASLGALAIYFCIHLAYAWHSFVSLGSVSDAQARYYNMLWPGFVFALAIAVDWLAGMVWRGAPKAP